jgi:hypothetical protein
MFNVQSLGIKLPQGTYTLTFKISSGSVNKPAGDVAFYLRKGTLNADNIAIISIAQILNNNNTYSQTFTIDNDVSLYLYSYTNTANVVFNDTIIQVQLSKGATATNFEQYVSKTYNIDLPSGMELCKIRNYVDFPFHAIKGNKYYDSLTQAQKDLLTYGKWYLHKEIGKVVLNGSENWSKSGTYTGNYYCQNIVPYALGNTPSSMICNLTNIFIGIASQLPDNDNCILLEGANVSKTIDFKMSSITTLDDFKTFLGNTNLILYYVLATPTNIEVEYHSLINQLNLLEKAMSKDGQTNISQVNNDLPFIISASALKEWQENTSLNSTLSMVNPLSLGNTLNTQEIENNTQPIEVDNIEPLEEEENEES